MKNAELTPNRKNARCPGCHALLAMRTRQPDGTHVLSIDPDWRLYEPQPWPGKHVRVPSPANRPAAEAAAWAATEIEAEADERHAQEVREFGPLYLRHWRRRLYAPGYDRHGAHDRRSPTLPVRLTCRCGAQVVLDAAALDVDASPLT